MTDKTLEKLKKRVLDILCEYEAESDEVVLCDGDKAHLLSRIPSAVTAALVRMYESFDIGIKTSTQLIHKKRCIAYRPERVDGGRIEFDTDCQNVGIYFKYCGTGGVTFYSENGKLLLTTELSGDGTLRENKYFADFGYTGRVVAVLSENVSLFEFTVCENNGKYPVDALCADTLDSFALPEDFAELICGSCDFGEVDKRLVSTSDRVGFAPAFLLRGADCIEIEYKKSPETITDLSPDSLMFDMSPLAFEALVYLTAAELCREGESDTYTRLVYKYNDLSPALLQSYKGGRRNVFYRKGFVRRWKYGKS